MKRSKSTGRPRAKGGPRGDHSRTGPSFTIVHEDDDLVVVDKPPGLLSATPPGSDEPSVFRMLQEALRSKSKERAVWIIHRLDREASGLLVFARTENAFRWLKEDFRARRVERRYLALIEGHLPPPTGDEGLFQSFLREDRFGHVHSVSPQRGAPQSPTQEDDLARLAVTWWKPLASGKDHSLLSLRMDSGRKHQLRVHLSEAGHPIAGDERYGSESNPVRRLALHATLLALKHPATGVACRFESPIPDAWWKVVGKAPPAGGELVALVPKVQPKARAKNNLETSWDGVSAWYDRLIDEGRSDHFSEVIYPGALRLLDVAKGERVLDVACGSGHFAQMLVGHGAQVTGVDASAQLVREAERRIPRQRFLVGDARSLDDQVGSNFDAATCIMALMNIDPVEPVFRGIADRLVPNGKGVFVLLHPAFRAPRQTAWGFDDSVRPPRQFRRVDGYLSTGQFQIVMNPGEVSKGAPAVTTWTFHRPLQHYIRSLRAAGLLVEAIEEWPSLRQSDPGPRAAEENRIRREIPLFLGLRVRKPKL